MAVKKITPKPTFKRQSGMTYDMGHAVALGMKRQHPVRKAVYAKVKKGS